jgi:hypothetical protein
VVGQGHDLKVTLLAGVGVFGQDFVAFFDLLNRLLAFVGVNQGLGGEGVE